jgi:hypothetical protein
MRDFTVVHMENFFCLGSKHRAFFISASCAYSRVKQLNRHVRCTSPVLLLQISLPLSTCLFIRVVSILDNVAPNDTMIDE